MDRWDAETAVGHLASGMTSSIMVPTMFRQMLALPDDVRAQLPVPTLQTIVHGGEPCPIGLKQRMVDWLGPVFLEYFGMSEGGMTLASTEDWLARPGTVGRLATSEGILILDDDGNRLPPNTEGGVYFESGGHGFRYHRDAEKTQSAYRGTAFTAGDIGWVDDDGYLYISGRRADVIVSAGVNIYPRRDRDRARARAGRRRPLRRRRTGCRSRRDAGRGGGDRRRVTTPTPSIAALQAHADESVATYKRPTRYVVEDVLPRDDTGKLLRRQVRDAMWGDDSPFAVSR